MQFYLNNLARACQEKEAHLLEITHDPEPFCLQTSQKIQAYNPKVGAAAQQEANSRTTIPLGHESCGIEGLHLKNGQWQFESATCKIIVHPESDKEDTIHLLNTLKPIRQKIISRGNAGEKITVEIGISQPNPQKPRLADCITPDNLIRFPINNGRILAVCAEKGTQNTKEPISLQGIILHEIGHVLEQYLAKEKGRLLRSLEKNLTEAGQSLFEISPHYLSKQLPQIIQDFQTLQEMENKGTKSLKIQGNTWTISRYKDHLTEHFGNELFAEMAKVYYLEPILHGKPMKPQKSGWEAFDTLQHVLCREARYTLKKGKADQEIFPQKRKEPTIPLWGSISNLFN